MYKIRCSECGRSYDYDEDAFCPRCGAFNQPPKSALINAAGEVVRVDGISEAGHANSFVHEELHEENRERRRSGLDKGVVRGHRGAVQETQAAPPEEDSRPAFPDSRSGQRAHNPMRMVFLIIFLIVLLNILSMLFARNG